MGIVWKKIMSIFRDVVILIVFTGVLLTGLGSHLILTARMIAVEESLIKAIDSLNYGPGGINTGADVPPTIIGEEGSPDGVDSDRNPPLRI